MAKEIHLSRGQVAIVDDDDYDRVSQHKWSALKNKEGRFYGLRSFRKESGKRGYELMHRFILGDAAPRLTDHKDGNGLNNRRGNLRDATPAGNSANVQHRRRNNKSGLQGVSWFTKGSKWAAYISVETKSKFLGYFHDPIEAARAYDRAALAQYGEFAYLNFPPLPATAGMLEGLV